MSYCSVQEAWGADFGRMNINLNVPPPQKEHFQPQQREHFSNEYSNSDRYGLVPVTQKNTQEKKCGSYHDPNIRKQYTIGKSSNPGNVPYGYSGEPLQTPVTSSVFYPLDSDAGKDHILNYSLDYEEEAQLNPGCDAKTGAGCGGAFKHLTECSECRKKLIMAIDKKNETENSTQNGTNGVQIDATELALFIACGVFFIFLLDAIVKVTKRFVK